MRVIDADKFLTYLIFSKHIDELTCGEVKEAIEMCKVDVLDKIRAEIQGYKLTIDNAISEDELKIEGMKEAYADCLEIIDKYTAESEGGMSDIKISKATDKYSCNLCGKHFNTSDFDKNIG